MKKTQLLIISVIITGLLFGCGVEPRTEVISAVIDKSVEIGWDADSEMGTAVTMKTVRVKFDIYNCDEIQTLIDNDGLSDWLMNYAVCTNNGEKLQLDNYITFEEKKEKKHTFFVDYLVSLADESDIPNLGFSFTLAGFETNYDGEFVNISEEGTE